MNSESKKTNSKAEKTTQKKLVKKSQKVKAKPKAKKTIKKTQKQSKKSRIVEEIFVQVPNDVAFKLVDGTSLNSLFHLANKLEDLNDEFFYYHVNDFKDDFSNWIKDVFKEVDLANELLSSKDKHNHQRIILKHIVRKINPIKK